MAVLRVTCASSDDAHVKPAAAPTDAGYLAPGAKRNRDFPYAWLGSHTFPTKVVGCYGRGAARTAPMN